MTGDERNPTNAQPEVLDSEAEFRAYLNANEDEPEVEAAPPAPEPKQEAQPPAPPQQPAAPKPFAVDELPEEWRERVAKELAQREQAAIDFENRWKAQSGQLKPTQIKLAETERQLREMQAKLPALGQKPAGVSNAEWDEYERNFEQDAKAIGSRINPIETQLQTMAQKIAQWEAREVEAASFSTVQAVHPDVDEIKERPDWNPWLNDIFQRDEIAAGIISKARAGVDPTPAEGIWILNRYKEDAANADLYAELETLRAQVSGNTQQPAADPKAQAAVARRNQQRQDPAIGIKTGQSAPMGRRNATDGLPGEAEFRAFLAQTDP